MSDKLSLPAGRHTASTSITAQARIGKRRFPWPRLSWRRWLPFLGSAVLLWFLLRQVAPHDVWRLLRSAQWPWLAAGLGWYLLTNVLRAYRFGALLSWRGWRTPLRLVPDMVVLSFLNNVLPARGGELSFPMLMVRRHGLALGESLALLLIARFFDLLALASLYVVFAFLERDRLLPAGEEVVIGLGAVFLLALLCLLGLPWLGRPGLRYGARLLRRTGLAERGIVRLLGDIGERAVGAVERVHSVRVYLPVYGWSLLAWLGTFAWFAAFLRALELATPYPLVVVGATFGALTNAIPFIAVGGLGAQEAGWAYGFHLTGMATEVAIASGLAVNLLTLLVSSVLGVVSLAIMRRQRSRVPL